MPTVKMVGRLADDFFLMTHDGLTDKPRLSGRILGLGLAGALLGELILLGAVDIVDDNLVPIADPPTLPIALNDDPAPDEGEPTSRNFLDEIIGMLYEEQRLPVRDWLTYLGQQAPDRVGERLGSENLAYFKPARLSMLGSAGRWLPTDTNTARFPAIDVKLKIHNGKADTHHLMLLGLTAATGLNNESLWEIRDLLQDPALLARTLSPLGLPLERDPEDLKKTVDRLRRRLPLRGLLAHLEAVVGSAVISQRV